MPQARAFAPGSISCVFKIIPHDDPARMHSLGMSFTVSDGVEVCARRHSRTAVRFNGREIPFPTVHTVVEKLTAARVRIDIESPLALSSGFGLSGASALASAYAVDALLGLGRPEAELAMAAHVAEVENLTGLGDVCAQYRGGCLVKLKPGFPLRADPLPVPEQPVYYRFFSPIRTPEVIGDRNRWARINQAADEALALLETMVSEEEVDFDACVAVARQFSQSSGLLQDREVRETIARIEAAGGAASMIMLGNAVFSTSPFSGAAQSTLSMRKARVLDE